MTETQPTVSAARLNEWMYHQADAVGLRSIDKPETMRDSSVAEVRRSQRESPGEGALGLLGNGVQQLVSYSTTPLGFLLGALSPVQMAVQGFLEQFGAGAQGEALKHAYVRDAMHLAVLNLASNALPRGFVERTAYELRASRQGAEWLLTPTIVSPQYEALRAAAEQSATEGIEAARARGIVDAASLAMARRDPAFDTRFRNEPAFRFGVRAESVSSEIAGSGR